ncbi:MAG: ABC transporter ATP-binding protein [Bacteroidales bacterium]|nr:ABC transporter ATP-binding protein [Candidatus Scybalousia scybalohippi]MCQ2327495.1 ABC transporter ATP-binding protein [Bacteroidales bacterium]
MIRLNNISKSFSGTQVLKDISFEIKDSEIVSITGASGAGKTTLLNIMGTLEKADEGEIFINGKDIQKLKDKELSKFRNKEIGFVFQFHYLLSEFNALENTIMPAIIYGNNKKEAEEKAKEIFHTLGIGNKLDSFPNELSGGEQQRVAIARALINSPALILADEPTGNLDSSNAKALFDLFFVLREKFHQTFVIVTHAKDLSLRCDRQLVISDGKIIE